MKKVQSPAKDQDPKGGYAESDEDEVTGADAGEDTPKGKGVAKSMEPKDVVSQEDLEKSIEKLEEFTKSEDLVSRKEALLQKAKDGELTDEDRDELFKALGGKNDEPEAEEALAKGLEENETLQKALDVSDYLAEQHSELCKSLNAVGEVIAESDKRQHEFNLVLAKAVSDTGKLVKGIAEKLSVIASQPARPPKSQGTGSLQKSFAGAKPDELTRTQVLNGLDMLMEKSMSAGRNGVSESGEDILKSISKYEQTNNISRSMLGEVEKVLGAAH